MPVDEWYNKRKGQSLLVPGAAEADRGQCVQAADYALNEVYNLPYVWADAIDWWRKFDSLPQLRDNFNRISDGSIKKGDFVIFNEKTGSKYGHIDIAMQDGSYNGFQGADSNWGGNKTLHLVQHSTASYIIGSLRLKKEEEIMPDAGTVQNMVYKVTDKDATPQQIEVYTKKDINAPDGIWYGYLQIEIDRIKKQGQKGFKPAPNLFVEEK